MIIRSVNADTLYLILPFKVSRLALLYMSKHGGSYRDAVTLIYRTNMYKQLETESTKYWHLGPASLLEILEDELKS